MRQHTPKWIAACAGMLLTVSCIGGLSASATTVDDVIAHAYAVGLPDETIQQCINQYSSGQYTSEQCDAAIAELDAWAADRNAAVSSAIADGGKPQHLPTTMGITITAMPVQKPLHPIRRLLPRQPPLHLPI